MFVEDAHRAYFKAAPQATDMAVTQAHRLFHEGDECGAMYVMSNAGICFDGIEYYLRAWRSQ